MNSTDILIRMETIIQEIINNSYTSKSCHGPFKTWDDMYHSFREVLKLELATVIKSRPQSVTTRHEDVLFWIQSLQEYAIGLRKTNTYLLVSKKNTSIVSGFRKNDIRYVCDLLPFRRMFETLHYKQPLQLSVFLGKQSLSRKRLKKTKFQSSLNPSQCKCIEGLTSVGHSRVSVVNGPPGTGKTRVLVEAIRIMLKNNNEYKHPLLVTSECNTTIKKMVFETLKIVKEFNFVVVGSEEQVHPELYPYLLHKRISAFKKCIEQLFSSKSGYTDELIKELETYSWTSHIINAMTNEDTLTNEELIFDLVSDTKSFDYYKVRKLLPSNLLKSTIEDWIFDNTDLVFCTLCQCGSHMIRKRKFKTVIIDEAAHSIVPKILNAVSSSTEHLILAGDIKQCDPLVMSPKAKDAGLNVSLIERVLSVQTKYHYFLNTQYRMASSISKFPLREIYDNKVKNGVKIKGLYQVFDVRGQEKRVGTSYQNEKEVDTIIEWIRTTSENVAIVTPYIGQVKLFIKKLRQTSLLHRCTVYTIDKIQGEEADVIAISLVRTKRAGFIRDFKRLNVALTRAKHKEIIVGHRPALSKKVPLLKKLFDDTTTCIIK